MPVHSLPLAVRVYPDLRRSFDKSEADKRVSRPDAMLVFDTETTNDATQRLLLGSYRFIVKGECLEEGLFYGDDLSIEQLSILRKYVALRPADTCDNGVPALRLLSRKDFLKKFYTSTYKSRSLLVGFNLPFDSTRLGFDVANARGRFAGGFSLGIWSYTDTKGRER